MPGSPAAYGFVFEGLTETPWLALHGAEHWPSCTVERVEPGEDAHATLAGGAYSVGLSSEVAFGNTVHPGLARLTLGLATERGVEGVHAGALIGEDGAWLVSGAKSAGKSTLLAAAATRRGFRVLSDDAVYLAGSTCLGGPRSIDLRPDAAERFDGGIEVRPDDPRVRLTLPPEHAEQPLAGFVYLKWAQGAAEMRRLPPGEALRRLVERPYQDHFPRDPTRLLDLAGLPSFEFGRELGWAGLDGGLELLARTLRLSPG